LRTSGHPKVFRLERAANVPNFKLWAKPILVKIFFLEMEGKSAWNPPRKAEHRSRSRSKVVEKE